MLVWDDAVTGPRPGILVSHTIRGRTAFEESRAHELAELGYTAFALDVYGATDGDMNDAQGRQNMESLLADREELQSRLLLALSTLIRQPEVDGQKVAAIGFCFGGLCVLDLARIGAPVSGVVSFHGLFTQPGNTDGKRSNTRVLVLHGWDDPLARPDEVVALGEELTALGVDWQIHGYGQTQHAFSNPAANDKARGTVYDAAADRRSRIAMRNFLSELFE